MHDVPAMFRPERLKRSIGQTETFYARRNVNFATCNRWYFKQHSDAASSYSVLHDELEPLALSSDKEPMTVFNFPTHMINMAVSMSCQETPAIEVLTPGGEKLEKRGSKAEKVFMGTLQINGELQGRDLLEDYFHNLYLYGWGVIGTFWDDTRVPDRNKPELQKLVEAELRSPIKEDYREDPVEDDDEWAWPILVTVPHPAEIYPLPGGHRERWKGVFRRYSMSLSAAEEFFDCELPRATEEHEPARMVEDDHLIDVVDYWAWVGNEIWHCIFALKLPEFERSDDGDLAFCGQDRCHFIKEPSCMPEYDRLPYDIKFCIPTTDSRGEYFGLSLLYLVVDAVREAETLASRQAMIIDQYADPTYLRYYNTELAPDATAPDVQRGPGETVDLDTGKGQDLKVLQWAGSPPDVDKLMQLWLSFMKEWGFDPNIEGQSGLDSIVRKSGILAKLTVPIRQAEKGLAATHARIIRMMVRLVKSPLKVRGQLTVNDSSESFALDVTGNQMRGMQYAKVTIRARFPYEELQNVAAAQGAVAAGLMSKRKAMTKFLFVDDPDREMDQIEEERMNDWPGWMDGLGQMVFQKIAAMAQPVPPEGETMGSDPGDMGGSPEMNRAQALLRGLTAGGTPQEQLGMMGPPLMATGNIPGQPSPNGSIDQLLAQQGPGRPPL